MRQDDLLSGTEGSYYRGAFKTPFVISFISIILKSITGGLFSWPVALDFYFLSAPCAVQSAFAVT